MRSAKIFSILVFSSLALYGAIGFCFLPLATFQGDLTRMAKLPESMFGWRKHQPAIDPALLKQSSWQKADVLVVGDSFSEGRVWQTVLTRAGLRVHTESWDSVRGVCADFMTWLRQRGFNGKYIVFESVERNVDDGMTRSVACQRMQFHPSIYADTPRSPPLLSFDPGKIAYSGRFSIGIETRINAWKYDQASRTADFSGEIFANGTKLARTQNGCELFSHTRCKDALYLAEDRTDDLPARVLGNIDILNARLNGITPIWVFVPNKSTIYLYPNKQFWTRAEKRINSPDLLKTFRLAIKDKIIDLYPANNTHVSTTGYLLLGDAIYQSMQASTP